MAIVKTNQKQLYAQVAGSNVSNILKLKENYPNLLTKKIENIQKIINDLGKLKPCIKMTTKGPPQKYIIVSMGKDNISKFMASFSSYIANINKAFRKIKLDIMADYVWPELIGVTIITNKVASLSNLQVIENFVRNIKNVNSEAIEISRLSQLKFYLKIIGIFYFLENTNILITSNFVDSVIKYNYIFNNLLLISKPQVIKALSKSDIAIIWVNIWDV